MSIFCVETSQLLGFIVSKDEILVDPLKVKVILSLPPPATLHQLQSLQGREIILCRCWIRKATSQKLHSFEDVSQDLRRGCEADKE